MNEFDLSVIVERLEAMEECIISRIFDRIQYKQNAAVYAPSSITGDSPLDYIHRASEQILAQLGKFGLAEEKPFFQDTLLPADMNIVLKKEIFTPEVLNGINLTKSIKDEYINFILQSCQSGDDGERGSSAEADMAALAAISKRIHYGSFYVAESKYLSDPQKYANAVRSGDEETVMKLLTRPDKEAEIILRVEEKCEKIQSAYTSRLRKKISPKVIGNFYKRTIIPLTKKGELKYLFGRA
jgi:chorismate mutase